MHQGMAALKAAASMFAQLLSFEIDCAKLVKVPKKKKRQLELDTSSTCETQVMLTITCRVRFGGGNSMEILHILGCLVEFRSKFR